MFSHFLMKLIKIHIRPPHQLERKNTYFNRPLKENGVKNVKKLQLDPFLRH